MEKTAEIKNIHFSYLKGIKKVQAVKGVSFDVYSRQTVLLMGLNGAGKTTTIKLMLNFLNLDAGEIKIFSIPCRNPLSRQKLSYLPEKINLSGELSLNEHFDFLRRIYGFSKKYASSKKEEVIKLTGLEGLEKRRLEGFSKGQAQRAGIALSLFNSPEFLILDEPLTGLDPKGQKLVIDIIKSLKGKITVLISTHNFELVKRTADRVLIINKGVLVKELENSKEIEDIENIFFETVENTND